MAANLTLKLYQNDSDTNPTISQNDTNNNYPLIKVDVGVNKIIEFLYMSLS